MTQPSVAPDQLDVDGLTLDELAQNMYRNRWAGGNIMRGEIPAYPTIAAIPTASADYRYKTVVVTGGAGVADIVYFCRKTSADTYAWVDLSTPFTLTAGTSTSDLKDDLVANGIVTDGGATPLNLDSGTLTAGLVAATSLTIGGLPAGLVLAGSDTTERTMTTSQTDLSVISGLSIATGVPFEIHVPYRKSTGAAASVSLGLKLNATEVKSAGSFTTSANVTESGLLIIKVGPREANYLNSISAFFSTPTLSGTANFADTNPMPTATITSVTITGLKSSASITGAIKNVRVWAYPI